MECKKTNYYILVCFDYSDENLEKEGITCSVTRSYEMGCELGKRLMRMIENGMRKAPTVSDRRFV